MRRVLSLGFFLPLLLVVLMLVNSRNAAAQANRASITGTVTDSTGAVVAGAEITATNTGTNVPTKAVSNSDGIYVIPNLFPGQYSVEFKKGGFETLLRPTVTLGSTEVARLDAALKIGAVSETMTVTTDAPVLELERPSVGTNMKATVVNDLPLSIYGGGRFVETFAVDIPGNSMQNGPSMEAVQELQAQTSGIDVQSSITGGGVIAMNLKSGTNKFHGSALLYGVNELFNANTWTNDNTNAPKAKQRAWDYAGSVGGPIFKNKTFFYGTFERYTQVDWRMSDYSSFVPTSDFLGGNFGALLGPQLCNETAGEGGGV